jgi:hypothetical protein
VCYISKKVFKMKSSVPAVSQYYVLLFLKSNIFIRYGFNSFRCICFYQLSFMLQLQFPKEEGLSEDFKILSSFSFPWHLVLPYYVHLILEYPIAEP